MLTSMGEKDKLLANKAKQLIAYPDHVRTAAGRQAADDRSL